MIRREFDIAEGDAYNRALVDRAERRLKNLAYFKSVKITTEPGSAPDRVILNVDVEEQSTGEFSVRGGYSTADGLIGEVSVGERNLLGRGLYAKASVQYGQYARGFELSFVEPYFLGYRLALGLDSSPSRPESTSYTSYDIETIGCATALRLRAARRSRAPVALFDLPAEDLAAEPILTNCNNVSPNFVNTLPDAYRDRH